MSRLLLSFLVVSLAGPVTAQSGTIQYNQSNRLDFNFPPNSPMASRAPRSIVRPMLLTFSADGALFKAAPVVPGADGRTAMMMGDRQVMVVREGGGGPPAGGFAGAEITAFRMGGAGFGGGAGQDAVSGAFTDFSDGSYVEVREFLGRTFRIPVDRPSYPWRLTGEQAVFLGYPVFQATAQQDSTTIEAWFTPEIPVPAGPAQYGGLPGLILTLTVDSNRVTYTATSIDTVTAVEALKAPTDGSQVTRAEYDKIVEEKMAELSRQRRGRGN